MIVAMDDVLKSLSTCVNNFAAGHEESAWKNDALHSTLYEKNGKVIRRANCPSCGSKICGSDVNQLDAAGADVGSSTANTVTDSLLEQEFLQQTVEAINLCNVLLSKLEQQWKSILKRRRDVLTKSNIKTFSTDQATVPLPDSDESANTCPPSRSAVFAYPYCKHCDNCPVGASQVVLSCKDASSSSQLSESQILRSKLSAAEAQLQTLISNAPFDGVAILDDQFELIHSSDGYVAITSDGKDDISANYILAQSESGTNHRSTNGSVDRADDLILVRVEDKGGRRERDFKFTHLDTLCVPWTTETGSEKGYVLFSKGCTRANGDLAGQTLQKDKGQEAGKTRIKTGNSAANESCKKTIDTIITEEVSSLLDPLSLDSRSVFDLIPQIVFIGDANGETEYCNEAWFQQFDVKRGEPNQYDWHSVVHPDDLHLALSRWQTAAENGTPYISEHRCIDAITKTPRWYLCRALPLKDREGKIQKWFGTCTDVNEMKNAQRELVLTQQRAEAVINNCCAVLFAVDMDGIFTFYKGLAAATVGVKAEERIGRSYYEIFKDHPEYVEPLRKALTGETLSAEVQRDDFWYLVTFSPLYDERKEHMIGCVGVSVNVTDRKKQALELMKWEKIFMNSRSGMSICGREGNVLNANPAFAEMHGDTMESFIGSDMNALYAPESAAMLPKLCQQFIDTHHITFESMHIRRDGTTFPVLTDCTGVCDDAGKLIFCLSSYIDLTETKRAEEEKALLRIKEQSAIQASELKTQFLANMSHEIRTPLNGIMGMLELLWDSFHGKEEKQYLETARQCASSLLAIINDILDLSKIEAGKLKLEVLTFDVLDVIRNVIVIHSYNARKKGILLEYHSCGLESCYVKGDPMRLRQVLTNLLSNAIKFTSKGGVTVTLKVVEYDQGFDPASNDPGKRKVTVYIEDSGVGIHPDAMPYLFQPFSQADLSTTRKFGGTGLGLSISKQLITLMQGDIWAESKQGVGSRFWFTIDFEEAVEPSHDKSCNSLGSMEGRGSTSSVDSEAEHLQRLHLRASIENDRQNGKEGIQSIMGPPARVLVVDDNHVNRVVTSKILQRLGYDTHCSPTGADALEIIHQEHFDIVLMDCHMPDMDGYEATRLIRKSECLDVRQMPVIALTANALVGERDKCLGCGMDDYLCKPVSKNALSKTIQKWLTLDDPATAQPASDFS